MAQNDIHLPYREMASTNLNPFIKFHLTIQSKISKDDRLLNFYRHCDHIEICTIFLMHNGIIYAYMRIQES